MDAAVAEALGRDGGVRVDLRARGLTDSDAARLADLLGANGTVTALDLADNGFGAEGARSLGRMLATNATLTIVDVSGNPLGDEGVRSLGEAAALHPTLTTLDVANTGASPDILDQVARTLERHGAPAGCASVEEFHREIRKLDANCEDPSDTVFEKFDLAVALMGRGEAERRAAVETLEALVRGARPRDVRDLHALLMGRLASCEGGSDFAALVGLVGLTLPQFTKHREQHWPPSFDAISNALLRRAAVRDNHPDLVQTDPGNGPDSPGTPGASPPPPAAPGDFYRSHARAIAAFLEAVVGDTPAALPWALRALAAQFASRLLRVDVCSRPWPAAAPAAGAGIPAVTPAELGLLTQDTLLAIQPLVLLLGRLGVTPHLALHFTRPPSPPPPPADADSSGDDFSDFEAPSDEDLEGEADPAEGWDATGLGVYCWAAVQQRGAAAFPCLVTAESLLRSALPCLAAALETQSLTALHFAMALVDRLLQAVPKFTIQMPEPGGREGLSSPPVPTSGDLGTASPRFEAYFAAAQTLATVMALCPSQSHRRQAHACFMGLVARLAEWPRHRLLVAALKLCPYSTVRSLLFRAVKDEVKAEYEALDNALRTVSSDQRAPTIRDFSQRSAFLRPETATFVKDMIVADMGRLEDRLDPTVGALNVYRFMLTIDARYGCLGVTAALQRDAMRREVVVPLARRLEAMRTHAGAGMTQQWLLVAWMAEEVLNALLAKLETHLTPA